MKQPSLFGETQSRPRRNDRPEAAALVEVMKVLRNHPAVAWCERQNSGAFKSGDRFVRFGWRGCSDVLGQLKDGRFLACEVKAKAGRLRPEQSDFLERVRRFGGVGIVARNAADVLAALKAEGVPK
jgi:hypothetical protein